LGQRRRALIRPFARQTLANVNEWRALRGINPMRDLNLYLEKQCLTFTLGMNRAMEKALQRELRTPTDRTGWTASLILSKLQNMVIAARQGVKASSLASKATAEGLVQLTDPPRLCGPQITKACL
jgi:hypothetical protein